MHRILIVDDEKLIVRILREILTARGFDVVGQAHDGAAAVKLYSSLKPPPDVVLMDHRMPVKNGIEAMQEILAADPKARILFVSADSRVKDAAMAAGAVGFISKPFEGLDLLRAVKDALREGHVAPDASESRPRAITTLLAQAYDLGVEVGYYGHMENVGWVYSRLKELASLAEGLGAAAELESEYKRGKGDGSSRRVTPGHQRREEGDGGSPSSGGVGGVAAISSWLLSQGGGTAPSGSSASAGPEAAPPVLVEADLQVLARVYIGQLRTTQKASQELTAMLASLVPVRPDEVHGTGREVLSRGLQALVKSGWASFYVIDEFDTASGRVRVCLESTFARCCGHAGRMVCGFLEPVLSELASRAMGCKVVMVETDCMAKGSETCAFISI